METCPYYQNFSQEYQNETEYLLKNLTVTSLTMQPVTLQHLRLLLMMCLGVLLLELPCEAETSLALAFGLT